MTEKDQGRPHTNLFDTYSNTLFSPGIMIAEILQQRGLPVEIGDAIDRNGELVRNVYIDRSNHLAIGMQHRLFYTPEGQAIKNLGGLITPNLEKCGWDDVTKQRLLALHYHLRALWYRKQVLSGNITSPTRQHFITEQRNMERKSRHLLEPPEPSEQKLKLPNSDYVKNLMSQVADRLYFSDSPKPTYEGPAEGIPVERLSAEEISKKAERGRINNAFINDSIKNLKKIPEFRDALFENYFKPKNRDAYPDAGRLIRVERRGFFYLIFFEEGVEPQGTQEEKSFRVDKTLKLSKYKFVTVKGENSPTPQRIADFSVSSIFIENQEGEIRYKDGETRLEDDSLSLDPNDPGILTRARKDFRDLLR